MKLGQGYIFTPSRTRHTLPGSRHLSPPGPGTPPCRRACWEIQSTRRQSCLNRFYFINGQLRKSMKRNTSTSWRNSNVGGLQSPKNSSLNHLRIQPQRFPFLWRIERSALLIDEIKNQCTVFPSARLLSKWVIWRRRCALGFTRRHGTTQPSFEQNGNGISKHPGSWAYIMPHLWNPRCYSLVVSSTTTRFHEEAMAV